MKTFAFSGSIVVLLLLVSRSSQSQDPKPVDVSQLTSNQALMRDKLAQMNLVLEGITLDNFDQVKESAEVLRMISRATSWHVSDPTPQYERLSKNFQEQTADLGRHAEEQNVEAATLDLVRLNITCMHCHQHMRQNGLTRNE